MLMAPRRNKMVEIALVAAAVTLPVIAASIQLWK